MKCYHPRMAVLSLYYPVRPHVITRSWGVEDPLYKEFGFTRHNGIDLQLGEGQEIRAPFDCRVTKVATQPHGSGLYVSLLSRSNYTFSDGVSCRVEITFMHLSRTPVSVALNPVRLGCSMVTPTMFINGHWGTSLRF